MGTGDRCAADQPMAVGRAPQPSFWGLCFSGRPRRNAVLISWAAHDWAGRPWADEWQPITYLKRQRGGERDGLYVKARAMEAAKYATRHAVVREEGGDERRSPRLAEAHVAVA